MTKFVKITVVTILGTIFGLPSVSVISFLSNILQGYAARLAGRELQYTVPAVLPSREGCGRRDLKRWKCLASECFASEAEA